jgi:hypothetical protein
MTWREKYVCWILLIIARMVADDPALQKELYNLTTAIKVDKN